MSNLSNEVVRSICAMYDEGHSAPTISALTEVPAYKVRFVLKENGYSLQGGSRSAKEKEWPKIEAILDQVTSFKEIAEKTGHPYMTVVRWCREEGVEADDLHNSSEARDRVSKMADEGAKAEDIAREVGVSLSTVRRWLKSDGKGTKPVVQRKKYKKERYWEQVLTLHQEGKTVYEIASAIGDVNGGTISSWMRDEGLTPLYGERGASATAYVHPHREEALRRYLDGEVASSIEMDLHISKGSIRAWAVEDGVWEQGGKFKRAAQKRATALSLYRSGTAMDAVIKRVGIDYYALRIALDEEGLLPYPEDERPATTCPCGKRTGNPNLRYCSTECRNRLGGRRQKDPDNWITKTCLGCQSEFQIRKSSRSYGKYCSNPCAQKHTKTKQHIVVDDAVVLDSSYEALFWGLCTFLKIPVERFDREQCIQLPSGHHYGPDFYLPQQGLYVETKGYEDEDDRMRYAAWQADHSIVVLDRAKLQMLRGASHELFLDRLGGWSLISW